MAATEVPGLATLTAVEVEAACTPAGPWIRVRARGRDGGALGLTLGTLGAGNEPLVVQSGRPLVSLSLCVPVSGRRCAAPGPAAAALSEGVLLSSILTDDALAFLAFTGGRDPHRRLFPVGGAQHGQEPAREMALGLRRGQVRMEDAVVTLTFQIQEADGCFRAMMFPVYAPGLGGVRVPLVVARWPPHAAAPRSRPPVPPLAQLVPQESGGPSAGPHPWLLEFLVAPNPFRRSPYSLLSMTFFCDNCRTRIAPQDPVIHCFTCSASEKQRHDWLPRVSSGEATESIGYDLCSLCHKAATHGHNPSHVLLPLQKLPQEAPSPRGLLRSLARNWRCESWGGGDQPRCGHSPKRKRGDEDGAAATFLTSSGSVPFGRWLEATPRFWAETPAYTLVRRGDAAALLCLLHHPLTDCNQLSGRWLTDPAPDAKPGAAVMCFAQTPLDLAVELRQVELVRVLLRAQRIDPQVETVLYARGVEDTRVTPRARAVATGQSEVVSMLDAFAADRAQWLSAQPQPSPIVPHHAALGVSPETAWALPPGARKLARAAVWAWQRGPSLQPLPWDLWVRCVLCYLS
eukprot:TRINITY_DN5419_c0_g1_i1.p1 TRINITY_DN5419_c0_g1~~TRINITY_DN5419_c0_g1_i1.p1  ORF type:complete len:597 (+),score=147.88 TRINITY_DN5419_c0_g1_i1:75-1793(+)